MYFVSVLLRIIFNFNKKKHDIFFNWSQFVLKRKKMYVGQWRRQYIDLFKDKIYFMSIYGLETVPQTI